MDHRAIPDIQAGRNRVLQSRPPSKRLFRARPAHLAHRANRVETGRRADMAYPGQRETRAMLDQPDIRAEKAFPGPEVPAREDREDPRALVDIMERRLSGGYVIVHNNLK